MCIHTPYNPRLKLPFATEESFEEEEEPYMVVPVFENPYGDPNPHPLVVPNFMDPKARLFPPNFYNTVMDLSEEFNVPCEYVFMVMCGRSEDFMSMAEDIVETPLGQPVEYAMPYPLNIAWKYLMETEDPSLESDSDEEESPQPSQNPIPMDYVRELLDPLRSRLIMKSAINDYLRALQDENFTLDIEDSDKENNPPPAED